MNQKTCACLVWLFSIVGAIMILTSCATTYWQYLDGLAIHEGLWKYCTSVDCYTTSSDHTELNATKALLVIGLALIGISMLTDTTGICISRNMLVQMIVMEVVAISCVIGAYGLYAHELKKAAYTWGWSFKVGCAGIGIYGLGFVFLAVNLCQS